VLTVPPTLSRVMPVSLAIWCSRWERISKVTGSTLRAVLRLAIGLTSRRNDDVTERVHGRAVAGIHDHRGDRSFDDRWPGNFSAWLKPLEIVYGGGHEFAIVFEVD